MKDYLVECVERLREFVPSISIETQTWSDDTYSRLVTAGLEGAVHYQDSVVAAKASTAATICRDASDFSR